MTTTTDNHGTARDDEDVTSFAEEWLVWQTGHEQALAAPYGFLAITAVHWLEPVPQRFDGVPGTWRVGAGGAVVTIDPGEELSVDGVPIAGEHAFADIPERGGLQATFGDTVLEAATRGGHVILRPRRPDHPLRVGFQAHPRSPRTRDG